MSDTLNSEPSHRPVWQICHFTFIYLLIYYFKHLETFSSFQRPTLTSLYLSSYSIQNQFSSQSLPGELASEAWKTEKLMRAYEARKKLEIMGAMMFNSANRQQKRGSVIRTSGKRFVIRWRTTCKQLTNKDEGEADAECQDVTTQRLVVLPITLRKHTQPWIDVVLAQSLESHQLLFFQPFYIKCLCLLRHIISVNEGL